MKAKIFVLVAVVILVMAPAAMAQETTLEVDPAMVMSILMFAGLGGGTITVASVTQLLKKTLNVEGGLAVLVSAGVSVAATAIVLIIASAFNILALIGYSVAVFGAANGYYKIKNK